GHARFAQQVAIVFGLGNIAARKTVAVPDDDRFELPGLGILDHLQKPTPSVGGRAGDGVVHVLTDDLVAVFLGETDNFQPLVAEALLLLVGAAAQVRHSGDQVGCRFDHAPSFHAGGTVSTRAH